MLRPSYDLKLLWHSRNSIQTWKDSVGERTTSAGIRVSQDKTKVLESCNKSDLIKEIHTQLNWGEINFHTGGAKIYHLLLVTK